MFNDAKKELERLEAALREEEPTQPLPKVEAPEPQEDILDDALLDALLNEDSRIADGAPEEIYKSNYSNRRRRVRIYNSDKTDVKPEDLSRDVLEGGKQKGIAGLVALALALTAGIVVLAVYWLLRFGGQF